VRESLEKMVDTSGAVLAQSPYLYPIENTAEYLSVLERSRCALMSARCCCVFVTNPSEQMRKSKFLQNC
jgi:hypothetical protein